jgi:ComEC/Rec2-related protein
MLRRHLTPAILAFCFMLGCCFLRQPLAGREATLAAAALAVAAAGMALAAPVPGGTRRAGILLVASAGGVLLGVFSLVRMSYEPRIASLPFPESDVSGFSGVLRGDSVLSSKGDTILRVSLRDVVSRTRNITASARGTVLARVRGDYRFALGQEISCATRLSRLDAMTGETWSATVERKDLVRRGFSSRPWALRAQAREWLHRAIARAGYPASALMEALLIGSREDVPPDLSDGFRKTGSLHILALSGLHVGVLYALLLGMVGFFRSRPLKLLIATLVLVVYQILAGFMPSLLRATVMIMLAGAGFLLDRDAEPLNLLALSGVFVLLVSPWQAFSLSFQLSYLALAGILAVGPVFQRLLESHVPRVVLAPLTMSLGAQIATFPLIVARFGVYYPSGLVAALILVPLTTAVLWGTLGWLAVFVIPWPALHDFGARGFSILYEAIHRTASVLGSLPGITVAPSSIPWAVALSAGLTAALAMAVPARLSPLRAR